MQCCGSATLWCGSGSGSLLHWCGSTTFHHDADPGLSFNFDPDLAPHQSDANLRPLAYGPSTPPFRASTALHSFIFEPPHSSWKFWLIRIRNWIRFWTLMRIWIRLSKMVRFLPCRCGSGSTKQQQNVTIDYYNAANGIYDGNTMCDEEPEELLHRRGPRIMLEHFRTLLPVVGHQSRLPVEEFCHISKFAADLDKHAWIQNKIDQNR